MKVTIHFESVEDAITFEKFAFTRNYMSTRTCGTADCDIQGSPRWIAALLTAWERGSKRITDPYAREMSRR